VLQALLYFIAVILLITAAFAPPVRVNLALLGAGIALLAYVLPVLTAAV
jgi:hypothetical protein